MTAALTPALALAYLHELSTDVRAAIVLDAAGEVLAATGDDGGDRAAAGDRAAGGDRVAGGDRAAGGDRVAAGARAEASDRAAALAAPARALLAEAPLVRALTARGGVFGARDDRHGIVVATGPFALPGLALHDLRSVLAALGGTSPLAAVSEPSAVLAAAVMDAL
jgi:hypothetical protein